MKITLTTQKKVKPDFTKLGFGKYFTDHMLVMDYKDGIHLRTSLRSRYFRRAQGV